MWRFFPYWRFAPAVIAFSLRAWNRLTPENRAAVEALGREQEAMLRQKMREGNTSCMNAMKNMV
jgi:TRAP-type C4-dicarboxylate transport system substrate-binding protein